MNVHVGKVLFVDDDNMCNCLVSESTTNEASATVEKNESSWKKKRRHNYLSQTSFSALEGMAI